MASVVVRVSNGESSSPEYMIFLLLEQVLEGTMCLVWRAWSDGHRESVRLYRPSIWRRSF